MRGRRRRAAGEVVRATWHASDEPNRNYHHRRRSFIKPRDCVSRSMIVRPLRSGFTQQVFLWDTERQSLFEHIVSNQSINEEHFSATKAPLASTEVCSE